MERRPNRERPAGGAAGRRRPPQHHQHQQQQQQHNVPCGSQADEEHRNMCHIVKKKKDQIKRLEELLQVRDKHFSSEYKQYFERVSKLEDENRQLKLALQKQEQESQRRFNAMVARYGAEKKTASDQNEQVLGQEIHGRVQLEYQEKVAHMEHQLHQMGADLLTLQHEHQSLLQTLSGARSLVSSKDAARQQSGQAWQGKYNALKESLTQQMAEQKDSLETEQARCQLTFEAAIQQQDAEILRLKGDNADLTLRLSETTQELTKKAAQLLQSQTSWQDKYMALESTAKDLAEKQQSQATEVTQLAADKAELEDLCLFVNKKRKRFLFFPRRSSGDRETQLQHLKTKMHQNDAKKKEEEMGAAACSA